MRSNNPSIKTNSASTGGDAIRSATRQISGNAREGKVSFMSLSKNASDSKEGEDVNKSVSKNVSDEGAYSKDSNQGHFAARLTQASDSLAFRRLAKFTNGNGVIGAFAGSTAGGSGGIGILPIAGSWGGTGAVAAGIGNDSLPNDGTRWNKGDSGHIGGIAKLDGSELDQMDNKKGDGNFSVINSTVSSKVSWMTNQGNYLTQHIKDEV